MGCTPVPALPVQASDGEGTSINVDWAGWSLEGHTGPYTVLRATNPGPTAGIPITAGGCAGSISGTSCVDDDSLASGTVYFYTITNSVPEMSWPEGGFIGTLPVTLDPSREWRASFEAAREYFETVCPPMSKLPYAECTATCQGGGTLTQSAVEISGSPYFLSTAFAVDCVESGYTINGGLQGPLTNVGAGYVIGLMYYDEVAGDNDGQSYSSISMEILGTPIEPSNSFLSGNGFWNDTEYNNLAD
jgi:hypothetical protein